MQRENQSLVLHIFSWYFLEMPAFIARVWRNFLRFVFDYFSIRVLFRTFFSHWRRTSQFYGKGLDFRRIFDTLTLNVISRVLGAVIRSFFIVTGLFFEGITFLIGALAFIGWFLIIPLTFFLFYNGLRLIF